MRKIMFRTAFIISVFILTTAVFATPPKPFVGAADDVLEIEKPLPKLADQDKQTIDASIVFSTEVAKRWRIQDTVRVAITNPLPTRLKGNIVVTVIGDQAHKRCFNITPKEKTDLKFELNPMWDGHSKVMAEAVITVEGLDQPIIRSVDLGTSHRLSVNPACPLDRIIEFKIVNPTDQRIKGKIRLLDVQNLKIKTTTEPFDVSGQTVIGFTLDEPAPKEFSFGYELIDGVGRTVLRCPAMRYTIIEDFSNVPVGGTLDNYKIVNEKGSDLALVEGAKRDTHYVALPSLPVCKLRYNFGNPGERFSVAPVQEMAIPENPVQIGYWIYGDSTNAVMSSRLVDSSGNKIDTEGIPVGWQGWRYRSVNLDGGLKSPLKIDSLFVLDSGEKAVRGTFYIGPIMIVSPVK